LKPNSIGCSLPSKKSSSGNGEDDVSEVKGKKKKETEIEKRR